MTTDTAAPTTAPVEVVTPIKPSEAIRLGCLIAPVQAFGTYSSDPENACAVGAMNLGWGRHVGQWNSEDDSRLSLLVTEGTCPADNCLEQAHVPHLNDDHRWSRERIADWLEGLGL